MTRKIKLPKCPACKDRGKVVAMSQSMFRCLKCLGNFDDDPDEGGTHFADPSRRMLEQEKEARRKTNRTLKGGFG